MDPDIFAIISAKKNNHNAWKALTRKENSHFFAHADYFVSEHDSRASTPDLPNDEDHTASDSSRTGDRLELRFSDGARLKDVAEGWQLCSSQHTSDVVLCPPGTPNVSRRQFSLLTTSDHRIVFHQMTKCRTFLYLYDKVSSIATATTEKREVHCLLCTKRGSALLGQHRGRRVVPSPDGVAGDPLSKPHTQCTATLLGERCDMAAGKIKVGAAPRRAWSTEHPAHGWAEPPAADTANHGLTVLP